MGTVPVENGTLDLAAAVESGTVTGLGLDYTPPQVFLSLRQPADGLNLFPTVAGVPTPDGFDFDLSGLTDVGGYRLDYLVAPPADGGNGSLALGNGVEGGVVSGLGLSYTPSSVLIWVDIPTGGLQISAMVVGNPSSDGFSFTLSAMTDSVNYRLGYLLIA